MDSPRPGACPQPLLYARTEQRAWLASVDAYLAGKHDAPPRPELPNGSACAWLRSEGHQRYCNHPAFQEVERQYQRVHALVRELRDFQSAGRHEAVESRLAEFRTARDVLLTQMKQPSRAPLDRIPVELRRAICDGCGLQ